MMDVKMTKAIHEATDLYRLTSPQSRQTEDRREKAPLANRKNHPKAIVAKMLGLARSTESIDVLALPQLRHGGPVKATSSRGGAGGTSVSSLTSVFGDS
ncbi:hypothetical protein [Oceaniferula spumae]